MSTKLEIIRGTVILLLAVAAVIYAMRGWWKRSSDDHGALAGKWLASAGLLGIIIATGMWLHTGMQRGDYSVLLAPFVFALCGIALAALWIRNIVNTVFRPLWSGMDGADEELEPQPLYSIARAKRKKGKYAEALADVRAQLVRFPTDVEGQLLVAEILAEDMNDLPGAEIAIHRFVEQPGHAPRNIAFALSTLADWHLKYAQDRDAARQALERISELCPNTEMALVAGQRIAHLADTAFLLSAHDRARVPMRKGVDNIGLLRSSEHLQPQETDPAKLTAECVAHLEQHPLDTEVREKLAVLYADHYQRLDLATDQLEQLIGQPNQPAKSVAHWLNLLADLQVRHRADFEAAWTSLGRITEMFPDHSVADLARNRMDLLALEFKGKEKSQTVKLGSYEQNIGLKRGLPKL